MPSACSRASVMMTSSSRTIAATDTFSLTAEAPRELFAELMGHATGVSGGRGGSQHLHWQSFYSSGVLGGTVPLATGMALAEKRKGSGAITVVFLGDGALGEGIVYEAINMASLWAAPLLFAVETQPRRPVDSIALAAGRERARPLRGVRHRDCQHRHQRRDRDRGRGRPAHARRPRDPDAAPRS